MAWGFRKSFSIGGIFRLNLSKGGVGASVGVKGARVSIDPRGKASAHVGAGGVYARQSLVGGRRARRGRGTTPIALAAGVVAVAALAIVLLWPERPKAKPAPTADPLAAPAYVDPMADKAKAQRIWKLGDPVSAPKAVAEPSVNTEAPAITDKPEEPEWELKPGGISGSASLGKPDRNGMRRSIHAPKREPTRVSLEDIQPAPTRTGQVWVEGYRRADGTEVKGHWRDP